MWYPCTKGGLGEVKISYHWYTESRDLLVWDGLWTPLPQQLGPGDVVTVPVLVKPPDQPGRYVLTLDMVAQDIGWFSLSGLTNRVDLTVEVVA